MIDQIIRMRIKTRIGHSILRFTAVLVFSLTMLFAQQSDEIIFKNGGLLKGQADRESLSKSQTSIRFLPKGMTSYQYYNVDQINFVRSWNGKLLYPLGVTGNLETWTYHLPNVKHLPSPEYQVPFSTEKIAQDAGYKACPGCFDPSPMISDYLLEKQLGYSTILELQRDNEIIYEHPRLAELQEMVKAILTTWPETLKGYDYRVQVIRDETPNAYAVPGGNLYFTTGLLEMIEYPEELESVLSHEIAHVERRHGLKQFYQVQEAKANLALLNSILVLTAIAMDSDVAAVAGSILSIIASFSAEFAIHGYSRDLEQEADILAQIRLEELGRAVEPMLSIMDKIATHAITRNGFIKGTNAYSSHPDILGRINQLEHSSFHVYDEPLVLQLFSIDKKFGLEPGFVELAIKYAYETSSSTNSNNREMVFVGTIHNNHQELGFRINEINLNFLGGVGPTPLKEISGLTVSYASSSDFVGRISYSKAMESQNRNAVNNKKILPVSVDISAIVFSPGEDPSELFGLQNIKCTMTIK